MSAQQAEWLRWAADDCGAEVTVARSDLFDSWTLAGKRREVDKVRDRLMLCSVKGEEAPMSMPDLHLVLLAIER